MTDKPNLSGAAIDTLHCLFIHGPTFDGDVPSKGGRDELVKRKLAMRHDGYQTLTINGLRLGLSMGLDRKKEQWERGRRERLANASGNAAKLAAADGLIRSNLRTEQALHRIVAATHSHIDGRDLLEEIHPRRTLNIVRRVDARETTFEGDWLSNVWAAVKEAKALLYSREIECRAASAMSAGTAETAQQAQGEARQRDGNEDCRDAHPKSPNESPQP